MSKELFKVSYTGDGLVTSPMYIREISNALIDLTNLFREANRIINNRDVLIKFSIDSEIQEGSCQVSCTLRQIPINQLLNFLKGNKTISMLEIKELIFSNKTGVGGLYWLINKLKGNLPKAISDLGNGNIEITFEDDDVSEVSRKLLQLYQNVRVRDIIQKILQPLKTEGIDTFQVKYDDYYPVTTITKSSMEYFDKFGDEILLETESEEIYSIGSLSFDKDDTWILFDAAEEAINAYIKDEDFIYKVNNNQVSFRKGDSLICRVKTIQSRNNKGLKTEYIILKINEHIPAIDIKRIKQ